MLGRCASRSEIASLHEICTFACHETGSAGAATLCSDFKSQIDGGAVQLQVDHTGVNTRQKDFFQHIARSRSMKEVRLEANDSSHVYLDRRIARLCRSINVSIIAFQAFLQWPAVANAGRSVARPRM